MKYRSNKERRIKEEKIVLIERHRKFCIFAISFGHEFDYYALTGYDKNELTIEKLSSVCDEVVIRLWR